MMSGNLKKINFSSAKFSFSGFKTTTQSGLFQACSSSFFFQPVGFSLVL
ncbi:hypothetical protein [Providencia hangzhouensis]